ncbi:hypothetical protein K9N68_28710 [Kovacikia minuta CCNUW1]|uniref:hypothetical protein n=1 Tax=Kovacikia minuta TaxID=2931930 RepID=UPI001CCC572F|nr:hypothetical protein [Kovacikia minuta]UBF25519.1 hypothetical protein K9N68_28710 [Kovacikia minuta CCNUW1]
MFIEHMADIYVAIRNQDGFAMSSISGEIVTVLIIRNALFEEQCPVTLRGALATFQNLISGNYTIIARHPDLEPTEARQDVSLMDKAIFGIRFIYNEPQRRLVAIETEVNYLP